VRPGRGRDGPEYPAEIRLAPTEAPTGTMVAAAVRDLTERVEGERRRDEAARRMESLGELAGGVAHDFNNLLTVIGENARFALEGSADPVARESLEEIQRASERGAELAAQLLVFGRPGPAGIAPTDLNSAIADVERLLSRTLGGGISLEVRLDPALAPVGAARGQIDQILLNLAINARDAMPGGGRLEIATEAAAGHARLTVTDEGTGMPPEVAERAFEPFFSTKPQGQGTGLGLATVNGIVRRIGGRVSLRTEPGRGTIVIVQVPYARAGAPAPG
jgi:signal transduction histidine kinase